MNHHYLESKSGPCANTTWCAEEEKCLSKWPLKKGFSCGDTVGIGRENFILDCHHGMNTFLAANHFKLIFMFIHESSAGGECTVHWILSQDEQNRCRSTADVTQLNRVQLYQIDVRNIDIKRTKHQVTFVQQLVPHCSFAFTQKHKVVQQTKRF